MAQFRTNRSHRHICFHRNGVRTM